MKQNIMKKFLILLTSIALLSSLYGCSGSAAEQTVASATAAETAPASEGSAFSRKLQLTAEPTGEIGFIPVPREQLGKAKTDLVYANLSEVKITLDGKTEPLEDAIRTGKITGAEIFAYARMDAENGFCTESFSSVHGQAHFIYAYPECALEIAYDVFESPDGKQTLINEIAVWDTDESLSTSDHVYVDESNKWGYFLDREDWGLEFTVKAVTPESLTVTYTQKQAQELGELSIDSYMMYSFVEGAQDEFVAQSGREALGLPIAITSDDYGEITIDWSETAGKLEPGNYYLMLTVTDNYDPEKVPQLVVKYHNRQSYHIEFTVEPG